MRDISSLVAECRDMALQGRRSEDLLRFLRDAGCSKVDSITVLESALGIQLQEAKTLVHSSKTWADLRQQDDAFHDSMEEGAKEL